MIIRLLIIVVWLCLLPIPLEATTYYVKTAANGGSDGAAGTSWATAWATIAKVNTTISEGDSVYFGTGTWYQSNLESPAGGNTDDWTSYLDSTGDSTTMNNTRICAGMLLNGTWVQRGTTNIWAHAKTMTAQSFCVSQNDSTLLPDASVATLAQGGFFEDIANDSVYIWCYDNANPNTTTIIAGTRNSWALEIAAGCRAVSFIGINFSHGAGFTVVSNRASGTDGPDFISFEYCWLSHSGGNTGENTGNFYSVQGSYDTTQYSNNFHFYHTKFGPAVGDVRGYVNNLNNVVTYGMHHTRFTDCLFVGHGIGAYLKDQYGAGGRSGISFVGCTFKDCQQAAFKINCHSDSDSLVGCTIYNCDGAVWVYGSSTEPYGGRTFIAHNTIFRGTVFDGFKFVDASGASGVCLGTDNKVKYNIVSACSTVLFIGLEDYHDICTDFWTEMTWDGNLYYGNAGTIIFSTELAGCGSGTDWDHWHTTCGLDPNGSNSTDPDFHDVVNHDFSRDTYDLIADSVYIWPYWFVTEGAWTPRNYGEPPEPPAASNSGHIHGTFRGGKIQ